VLPLECAAHGAVAADKTCRQQRSAPRSRPTAPTTATRRQREKLHQTSLLLLPTL
jgi:hypothetical protein